jgi:hypothetical protein
VCLIGTLLHISHDRMGFQSRSLWATKETNRINRINRINRLLTIWKEYMNNPFTEPFTALLRRFRARRINRMILKEIHSLRDERVAHLNSIKPLKEHLEEIESRNLTRDINLDKYSNSLLRDNDNKNINDKFYEDLKL